MMKYNIYIIAFFMITWLEANADSLREYYPYSITSSNNQFYAQIDYISNEDAGRDPWEREWKISVYTKDSILFWSKSYSPQGYAEGRLSDNGKCVIYIEDYYDKLRPLVYITTKDKNDFTLNQSDLLFTNWFLKKTSSNELWLSGSGLFGETLVIETNEGIKWQVNLTDNKLYFKGLSIWLISIIGITIGVFYYLYFRFLKTKKHEG